MSSSSLTPSPPGRSWTGQSIVTTAEATRHRCSSPDCRRTLSPHHVLDACHGAGSGIRLGCVLLPSNSNETPRYDDADGCAAPKKRANKKKKNANKAKEPVQASNGDAQHENDDDELDDGLETLETPSQAVSPSSAYPRRTRSLTARLAGRLCRREETRKQRPCCKTIERRARGAINATTRRRTDRSLKPDGQVGGNGQGAGGPASRGGAAT